MSFQIVALSEGNFQHLFSMSDEELKVQNARREIVDEFPGTPCRVSLEDAKVGEEVILVHYEHQPEDTPYKASHAIFIRKGIAEAVPQTGEVPTLFRHRLMSVRAFDSQHNMINADAVEGEILETAIEKLFSNLSVDYIHLHYAMPGCYAALVLRIS